MYENEINTLNFHDSDDYKSVMNKLRKQKKMAHIHNNMQLKQRAKVDDVNNNYTHITYGGPTSSNTGATYANCIPITGTFNGCGADNIIVSSDSN